MSTPVSSFLNDIPIFIEWEPLSKLGPPAILGNGSAVIDRPQVDLNEVPALPFSSSGNIARKSFAINRPSDASKFKEEKARFQKELNLLYHAKHYHVVNIVYAYIFLPPTQHNQVRPHAAIIMELASDFTELLCTSPSAKKLVPQWFKCLASTLAYLHGIGIRHRDIKPQNILVDKKGGSRVLFVDFGISNMVLGMTLSTTNLGLSRERTPEYCAPEVEGGSSRSKSADIFSLGTVFLQMMAHQRHHQQELEGACSGSASNWSHAANLGRIHELIHKWIDEPAEGWEKELLSLCLEMMDADRYKRPNASAVFERIANCGLPLPNPECNCAEPKIAADILLEYCRNGGDPPECLGYLEDTIGAVQQAAAHGHLKVLEQLWEKDFKLNLRDYHGQTALHCAVTNEHVEVVKYLLDKKVDINAFDDDGRTPLHYAAVYGNESILDILFKNNCLKTRGKDVDGRIAFHFAATRGRVTAMKRFLEHEKGGSGETATSEYIEIEDKNGVTALHLAAGYGSTRAVELLLKNGADANAGATGASKEDNPRFPLHFAINGNQFNRPEEDKGQYESVVKMLLPETNHRALGTMVCGKCVRMRECEGGLRGLVCQYLHGIGSN